MCTNKKAFAFLVQFLSEVVPYETGHYLKVVFIAYEIIMLVLDYLEEIFCSMPYLCSAYLGYHVQ